MLAGEPYIPQTITVHLGAPDSGAENVTVDFPDYIKNVASSEIYPTWDEAAIRANVYAQISYALNRVYLEYYRSRGYNFDITNSTAIDQSYVPGRNIFDNIDRIVSEIFTTYIRREDNIEPLAAKYCNGTTTTCDGLSQWGSQELARSGLGSYEILTNYYGDDIVLETDTPVMPLGESYPGTALRLGSTGNDVVTMQAAINRISQNYPLINKISPVDGVFGETTDSAVRTFQQIFNLSSDGIIGRATWYKVIYLYVGIARLSELYSEGNALFGLSLEYPDAIELGNTGEKVTILQYFINIISAFYPTIPQVPSNGTFGRETQNAVIAFQKQFDLPQTGIVDAKTWDTMYEVFQGIVNLIYADNRILAIQTVPFDGETLKIGSTGDQVKALQEYLNEIALVYTAITPVTPAGVYGTQTRRAVMEYQRLFELPVTGEVTQADWTSITNTYKNLMSSTTPREIQYPGQVLRVGSRDDNM